jgi:hypothetical protein
MQSARAPAKTGLLLAVEGWQVGRAQCAQLERCAVRGWRAAPTPCRLPARTRPGLEFGYEDGFDSHSQGTY